MELGRIQRQILIRPIKPTANTVLPKAGVTNFYDTFVLNRTFVFQFNSSAETPRLRQYPNRCVQAERIKTKATDRLKYNDK